VPAPPPPPPPLPPQHSRYYYLVTKPQTWATVQSAWRKLLALALFAAGPLALRRVSANAHGARFGAQVATFLAAIFLGRESMSSMMVCFDRNRREEDPEIRSRSLIEDAGEAGGERISTAEVL